MAVDKEIKFKFVVDQTSLQSAKRQIEELVSAFSNLQGQAQKAIAPTQNLMGSMILGPDGTPLSSGNKSSGGKPLTVTGGGSSVTSRLVVNKGSSNMGSAFTDFLRNYKNAVKGFSDAGKEGVDLMTIAVKRGIAQQIEQIDKLENRIKRYKQVYEQRSEQYQRAVSSGDTELAAKLAVKMDRSLLSGATLQAKALGLKQQTETNQNKRVQEVSSFVSPIVGQIIGRMTNSVTAGVLGQFGLNKIIQSGTLSNALSGWLGGLASSNAGGVAGGVAQKAAVAAAPVQMQLPLGPAPKGQMELPFGAPKTAAAAAATGATARATAGGSGVAGGVIGGAAGVSRLGMGAVGAAGLAGLWGLGAFVNEMQSGYTRNVNYGAQNAALFAPQIQAAYAGDIRNTMAFSRIQADPSLRFDYERADNGWRRFTYGAKGVVSGLLSMDPYEVGRGLSGQTGAKNIIADRQEFVNKVRQMDPLREMMLGDIQENYMGRIGAMRALRVGNATDVTKLGGDKSKIRTGFNDLEASLMKSGYSLGDAASALSSIESGGTLAAAYGSTSGKNKTGGLLFKVLNAQAGGLHAAGQFSGVMSRFGGSAGANFLDAARVMGGENDAAVANTLASFVAQNAAAQNTAGITGLGALGMLGMGLGGRGDVTNRMVAEQNMRGFGQMQNLMSGNIDAYQQGRNLQIAIGAAPTSGIYAQDYLATRMNMTQMADIFAGTGKVSNVARAMGVTEDMVKGFGRGVMGSSMERLIDDPAMANTTMGKTVASIMNSGLDPNAWFKEQSKNKKFNKNEAVSGFAAALLSTGQADSEAAAEGMARQMFGLGRKASTAGKKVGDAAGSSLELKQAEESAKMLQEKTKLITEEASELAATIAVHTDTVKKMSALAKDQNTTQEQVIEAMKAYEYAIRFLASGEAKTSKQAYEMGLERVTKEKADATKEDRERTLDNYSEGIL